MSNYNNNSPWCKVQQTWYLGYNLPAYMTSADSDSDYVIPTQYNEQPWMLAKELYGSEELYYIFALLNPDVLVDPVYDFSTGTVIKVPDINRVKLYLQSSRNIK